LGNNGDVQSDSHSQLFKQLVRNHDFITEEMSLSQALSLKANLDGRQSMIHFMKDHLQKTQINPLPVHTELTSIPLSTIITTNWDKLMETALRRAGIGFHTIIDDIDIPFSQSNSVMLLKLRGSIDRPDSIIATNDDLLDAFHNRPLIADFLFALCARKTILFIGYDLDDMDFMQFYKILRRRLGKFLPMSYAITQTDHSVLYRNYWLKQEIQIISTDTIDFIKQLKYFIQPAPSIKDSELWIRDPFLRNFIHISHMATANQVTNGIAEGIIKLLESDCSLDEIDRMIQQVINEFVSMRPNYRALDKLRDEILPQWFPPVCLTKSEARIKALNFLEQRNYVRKEIGRKGAGLLEDSDAVLTYSQSTCVLSVLNTYLQRSFPACEIDILIAECRPKSPEVFQDAFAIIQEFEKFAGPFHLVPDVAIGSLMKSGKITKVFMGAHGVMLLPNGNAQVTNTVGTFGICLLAAEFSIPVYFFAEKAKIYRASSSEEVSPTSYHLYAEEILLDEKSASLARMLDGKNIVVENPGFDNVSSKDVPFFVVTEKGVVHKPT
jgi:translation initiation factor 2B subunit (eIF-2B alpha/beta/delta family)